MSKEDHQGYTDICNKMDIDPNDNNMSRGSQLFIINVINPNYIKFINNPCKEAQIDAIQLCASLIGHIENPTAEAIYEACHKHPHLIKSVTHRPNYNEDVFYKIINDSDSPANVLYFNNDHIKITEDVLLLCLKKQWRKTFYIYIQQSYPELVNNEYFSRHIKKLKLVNGPLK